MGHIENSPTRKRWPLWGKLLLIASPLILLMLAAWVFDGYSRGPLDRALDEAREGGQPVTMDEIEAGRAKWPEGENGALIIVGLGDRLDLLREDSDFRALPLIRNMNLPPVGHRWDEETDQAVSAGLRSLAAELAEIDRLADFEGGRFPLELKANPYEILLSHLGQVRTVAKMKSLQVIARAMRGHTDTLVEDLGVIDRAGQLLADEPTLISSRVHVAIDTLNVRTLEHVCGLATLSDEQLAELVEWLGRMDAEDRMSQGMLGERACFIEGGKWFRGTGAAGGGTGVSLPVMPGIPGVRGWLRIDHARGIRMLTRLVNASGDRRKQIEIAREIDAEVQGLSRAYVLTRLLLPSLKRAFELDLRVMAGIRCAQTSMAIERYRLSGRGFPDRLELLVPDYLEAVPADPFDDKPLRYRMDAKSVVVYSIGENLTDDGGEVEGLVIGPQPSRPKDAGFVLFKPEFRNQPPVKETPSSMPASRPVRQHGSRSD